MVITLLKIIKQMQVKKQKMHVLFVPIYPIITYQMKILYIIRSPVGCNIYQGCQENMNTLVGSVPYQHFTNSIENYFSILKSQLQKLKT
jgi:hypothetical protein